MKYFASSVIAEPATLTMASVFEVLFASFSAMSESKVSPDCEMKITRVSSSHVLAVYLDSDAMTTSHAIPARDSMRYFPVIEA